MSAANLSNWIAPRPAPEILPATVEQASEYMTWFVNRRAYTQQRHTPDPESKKYFFYQARNRVTREPLALDIRTIQRHLQGHHTIGLYAINPETQCSKWVAIDADYSDAYRDLRALKVELQKDGVEASVEMSRRGWVRSSELAHFAHLNWPTCTSPDVRIPGWTGGVRWNYLK